MISIYLSVMPNSFKGDLVKSVFISEIEVRSKITWRGQRSIRTSTLMCSVFTSRGLLL